MNAAVCLKNVAKHYLHRSQRCEVLNGLDLEVRAGEIVAISGPCGCGKTTLLNVIGGSARADAGAVLVGGTALEQLGGAQLVRWRAAHVGMVPQLRKLSPWMTAEQNVEQPLLLTDLSRELRVCAVQAALQLVGMDGQGAREPGELSGGQQQRVAIARALVANPALLLCDEPTGGLDTHTAAQLLELLELVNQAMGTTVVMVTHDPAAAARADRQLHMACGRVSAAQLAA